MTNELSDKRALVCGGSQGIGRACAIELARLGARVTVVARDEAALRRAVSELEKLSPRGHGFLAADFRDPQNMAAAVASSVERDGPVHILVNNTGGPPHGPMIEARPEEFLAAFSQHLVCDQCLVQTVLPGMKKSGYGRIINIISTSVLIPIRGLGVSNTTRGAVANWGRTLAAELGPFGITVNNVLPGFTDTERLHTLLDAKAAKAGMARAKIDEQIKSAIPLGRFASADEIASVVGFLSSPRASYVSGVNLPVDGGRTAIQ